MAITLRRRSLQRIFFIGIFIVFLRLVLPKSNSDQVHEIKEHGVLERVVPFSGSSLDVKRHKWLQARMGRDERPDILDAYVFNGLRDYWERFQKPYIEGSVTSVEDSQSVLTSIDQLLSLNGWVAALCPTLTRPFGQNTGTDAYARLIEENHLYYIAIVIHSADHFLVDQLAVIVQLAKTLGTHNIFVSMLDYSSTDSTETLTDLCEAVLILLGVPFRIRRVSAMTHEPSAAYYPAEETYMRNLALEPLHDFWTKRKLKFHRVIWLKGFTCPNDILETLKVSIINDAAMVCGMDWSEHNGFYIFSDRWRTRDIAGDQFRQAKSSSKPDAGPPREAVAAERYRQHLPFQVFCCESGTHVVDPEQSYYAGISYRHGADYFNVTANPDGEAPERSSNAPCLDSAQAWFCRDLWVEAAAKGVEQAKLAAAKDERTARKVKREDPAPVVDATKNEVPLKREARVKRQDDAAKPQGKVVDIVGDDEVKDQRPPGRAGAGDDDDDADVGADYDAMPEAESEVDDGGESEDLNLGYQPARILVNPRCVTTYAGVSHTQLALDLFGEELMDGAESSVRSGKYKLDSWQAAPDSFVCQEQKTTGGRKASKTQRRLVFSLEDELRAL